MIRLSGKRPADLGVREGGLEACPSSPNCVCSQAALGDRCHVDPIRFGTEPRQAMETMIGILLKLRGVKLVTRDPVYLHAECRSRLLGFVDDLEILCDPGGGVFHVRSASRVGYGDLGVNRRRVETIRRLFSERDPAAGG